MFLICFWIKKTWQETRIRVERALKTNIKVHSDFPDQWKDRGEDLWTELKVRQEKQSHGNTYSSIHRPIWVNTFRDTFVTLSDYFHGICLFSFLSFNTFSWLIYDPGSIALPFLEQREFFGLRAKNSAKFSAKMNQKNSDPFKYVHSSSKENLRCFIATDEAKCHQGAVCVSQVSTEERSHAGKLVLGRKEGRYGEWVTWLMVEHLFVHLSSMMAVTMATGWCVFWGQVEVRVILDDNILLH